MKPFGFTENQRLQCDMFALTLHPFLAAIPEIGEAVLATTFLARFWLPGPLGVSTSDSSGIVQNEDFFVVLLVQSQPGVVLLARRLVDFLL